MGDNQREERVLAQSRKGAEVVPLGDSNGGAEIARRQQPMRSGDNAVA